MIMARYLFVAVLLSVCPSVFAGRDAKLPPQPREWVAPSTDMTPPSAEARFGVKWVQEKNLPVAVAGHSAVAVGRDIVVIGGVSGREHLGMRDVYVSTAGKSGLGSWKKGPAFPAPVAFCSAVAVGRRVYVMGGVSREGMHHIYDTVWSAEVKDGSLGKWREERKLPKPIMYQASMVLDGFIYSVGGFDGQAYDTRVIYSRVAPDGKLGEWKETKAPYPYPIGRTVVAPAGGDLLVCGGLFWDSQGEHISSQILRGTRSADGDITGWASEEGIKMASRSMAFSISEHAGAFDGNFIYSAGGRDPAALGVGTVQAAWISPAGKLTRWQFGPELPAWGMKGAPQSARLYQSAAVIAGDRLYVIGGFLSIREPTKNTWGIDLKPYKEPDWVKEYKARREKK